MRKRLWHLFFASPCWQGLCRSPSLRRTTANDKAEQALCFKRTIEPKYAETYTGTVTFTVLVQEQGG